MRLTDKEIAVVLKLLAMGVGQQRVSEIFDIGIREVRLLKAGQRRNKDKDFGPKMTTQTGITIFVNDKWLDQIIKCVSWYSRNHKHTPAEAKRVGFYLNRLKLTRAEAKK